MVHHRQCLTLGFKAGDDFARVHAHFDDLERDAAFHGLVLFCQINDAKAAFPDFFTQFVAADDRAGTFG